MNFDHYLLAFDKNVFLLVDLLVALCVALHVSLSLSLVQLLVPMDQKQRKFCTKNLRNSPEDRLGEFANCQDSERPATVTIASLIRR